MGIIAKVDKSTISEAFQKQNKNGICALEENFKNLQITTETSKTVESVNKVNKFQTTTKPTETSKLESKLKCLNLQDDDKELIERGPITTKDTKPRQNEHNPYQRAYGNKGCHEIVSNTHNCGVTLIFSNDSWQHLPQNNCNNSNYVNPIQATPYKCEECTDNFVCERCLLEVASAENFHTELSAFLNILLDEQVQIQSSVTTDTINTQTESAPNHFDDLNIGIIQSGSNTTQVRFSHYPQMYNLPTYEYNIVPTYSDKSHFYLNSQPEENTSFLHLNTEPLNISQSPPKNTHIFQKPRRISHDSGIGADMPSPLSDFALSPMSNNPILSPMPPPPPPPPRSNPESVKKTRTIRPKTPVATRSPSGSLRDSASLDNGSSTSEVEAQKEILLATLNTDIKRKKWVEYIFKGDTIFNVSDDGKTILHEILCIKDYLEEEFYTAVEMMKRNPTKCQPIIQDHFSIYKEIKDKTNNEVLADYFLEAIKIIQSKNFNT